MAVKHKICAALLAGALGIAVASCGGQEDDSQASQPVTSIPTEISSTAVTTAATGALPTSASTAAEDDTNTTEPQPTTTPVPDPTPPDTEPSSPTTTGSVPALSPELESLVQECDTWEPELEGGNGSFFPCLQGPEIMKIQQALKAWDTGLVTEADGYFGVDTQRALLTWQVQRDWPGPTVDIDRMMNLGAEVLSILENPEVSREAACPIWRPIVLDGPDMSLDNYRPLLRLCDSGQDVSNIQSLLSQQGFAVDVDGLYGLSTARALADFKRTNYGSDSTGDALYAETFWFIAGDTGEMYESS